MPNSKKRMLCWLNRSIGCGSWLFDMTLLYPMQLLDELPMIFGVCMALYAFIDLLISAHELKLQN